MASRTHPPVIKVARRNAVDDVREQIIGLIKSGQFRINDQLPPEIGLARSFGVSRSVVREALVSLQALGFTTSLNGRGTFVAKDRIQPQLLLGGYAPEHLNAMRRCLEVPSACLAARQRTRQDIARLRAILARLSVEEKADRRNKLDAEFHIAIAAAIGNPLFAKLVTDLRCALEDGSLTVSVVPRRRAGARAEHKAILDAIVRRDADAAGAAMTAHLDAIDSSLAVLQHPTPAS